MSKEKRYDALETEFSGPGVFTDIEGFKEFVFEQVQYMQKQKGKYNNENDHEAPIPVLFYVVFEDMSHVRSIIWPRSDKERLLQTIAFKKQIAYRREMGQVPIYACVAVECWVSSFKNLDPKVDKDLTPDERREKYKDRMDTDENGEKVTRVLLQFEDPATKIYDCKVFALIDPGILSELPEETELFSKGLTDGDSSGALTSLLNYTVEEELDAFDGEGEIKIEHFDIEEAVEFVRKALRDERGGSIMGEK